MTSEVGTIELLTRAADAAREAVRRYENRGAGSRFGPDWPSEIRGALGGPVGDLAALGGPDHWRAVEATLRAVLDHAAAHESAGSPSVAEGIRRTARPLAEQVLRDLGDTE